MTKKQRVLLCKFSVTVSLHMMVTAAVLQGNHLIDDMGKAKSHHKNGSKYRVKVCCSRWVIINAQRKICYNFPHTCTFPLKVIGWDADALEYSSIELISKVAYGALTQGVWSLQRC